jgi:WD40 repeat protein
MLARTCFAFLTFAFSVLAVRAENDQYGDPLPKGAKARLGSVRYRYGLNYAAVVTPDTKTIIASDNFTLSRYDIGGAALGAVPPGNPGYPPVAFSADGARAVTMATDVVVWEVATGKTLLKVKRAMSYHYHGKPLVDLSGDGKVVALGGSKEKEPLEVLVWDVDGKKEVCKFLAPQNEQAFVALSHDGKMVATWGKYTDPSGKYDYENNLGRFVNFFDATTGKPLSKVKDLGSYPAAAAFSPDGTIAAVGSTSTIELVDPKTGASKQLLPGRSGVGSSLSFSPDGTVLFAASSNGIVQRWRTADGSRLSTTEPPVEHLHTCLVRATGPDRAVARGLRSRAAIIWEAPSGKLLGPQDGHFTSVHRIAVTPDNRFVLTAGHDGQALKWDLASGKLVGPAPGHPWPGRSSTSTSLVDLHASGRVLISDHGGMGVHDIRGMQQFVIPTGSSNYRRATFVDGASKVITAVGSYDGKKEPAVASVWDVATAKRMFIVQVPGQVSIDAALTADGKHLITAGRKPAEKGAGEFFIQVWEVPGGAKKSEFSEEAGYGNGAVAIAGNETAAVVTSKGKLVRFDIASGKATPVVSGVDSIAAAPVFSAEGKLLVVLGQSTFRQPAPVAVLDWETGKTRQTFSCPDDGPYSAAFSPDGRYLLTGTNQGTVIVWELTK